MANMIPAASAEFETAGSTGNFVAWFGCTVAQSTAQALNGTGSMEVTSTGSSIGVQQDNWPGWSITGGQDVGISASCWKANPARTVSVEFDWRDEGGTSQQTDTLSLAVGGSAWVTESATVAVPATATRLFITITWGGNSSDIAYFDAIEADDAPGGGATEVAPDSATHSHTASQPSLTQTHELAPADAAHAHTATEPTLSQVHALAADHAVHGHTADQPTIGQVHELAPADASHGHTAAQPSLTQIHELTPDDATHSHTATQPTLTSEGDIAPDSATHGHTASQPSITQIHVITVDDVLHSHTADQPTVSEPSSIVGYTIGDDITGPAVRPVDVRGPFARHVATGPAIRHDVSDPALAPVSVTGPETVDVTVTGPTTADRDVTGPAIRYTVTGPDV